MSTSEPGRRETPWFLLAIYVVLAGQLVATGSGSRLTDLAFVVSLVPATIGFALSVQRYNDTDE